jgi:Ser/Thr protein kinase RdoA (MazF antagonist)
MNFAELPLVATPIALVDKNVVDEAIQKCMADKNLDNPRLIRESMNAVYLVQSSDGPQIMRVSRPTSSTMAAIEFAHYLARKGFEVPAPLSQAPFRHDEIEITFWEFINHDPHHDVDWRHIGSVARRLHDLDPQIVAAFYPLPMATSFPWWDFDRLLAELGSSLDSSDLDILKNRWYSLQPFFISAQNVYSSPTSGQLALSHGDIHPGNVIVNRLTGRPILIDWDLLSVAPREWDHAALLTWTQRWGGHATIYPEFATGYGTNFSGNELAEALAEMRLLSATLMRWRAGLTSPDAHVEAENRLKYWRQDPTAPMWRAV